MTAGRWELLQRVTNKMESFGIFSVHVDCQSYINEFMCTRIDYNLTLRLTPMKSCDGGDYLGGRVNSTWTTFHRLSLTSIKRRWDNPRDGLFQLTLHHY